MSWRRRAIAIAVALALPSAFSNPVLAAPPSGVPTGVTAISTAPTSITVSWTAVTGATSYTADAAGAIPGPHRCTTTTTACVIALPAAGIYTVTVWASNADGDGPSSASVTNAYAIPPPTGLSVGSPTSSSLTASWTDVSGVTSYTVTAYSAATDGSTVATCTSSASPCTVTGLSPNTQYWLTVKVAAPAGTNPDSARVTGTTSTGVPSAPQSVSTTVSNGAITARWSAPASNGGSAITGYRAQAWSAESGGSVVDFCETTSTSCQIGPLTNGTTYYIAVYATNTAGDGTSSSRISATPGGSPTAPRSVTATRGDGTIAVEWQAPATDASSVTSYTAQVRGSASSSAAVIGSCTATGLACTVSGLDNGTTYYVSVFATSSSGNSSSSSFVTVSRLGAPTAPRDVVATAGNGFAAVSWRAPADTGGSTIQRYVVSAYRAAEGGDPIATCEPNPLSSLKCNIGPLPNGSAYFIDVTATNSRYSSPASSPRVRVFTASVPDIPQAVTATLEGSGVRVRWRTPSTDGGYSISRYTATAFAATTGTTSLASCTATGDSCVITGLDGYAYISVVATTTAGNGPASSPRVQVFVPGAPGAPRAVAANPSGRSLTVSWLRPADDQGVPVQIYEAVATNKATSEKSSCKVFEPRVPPAFDPWNYRFTCDIPNMRLGAVYDVTVSSANTFSTVASSPITVTFALGPPSEPRGLVANPGDDHISVEALLPATNGGAVDVTLRFRAWTKQKGGKVASTCSVLLDKRDSLGACELTGLKNYEPYWVDAAAISEVGKSASLARINAEPAPAAPGTPRDFRVEKQGAAFVATWLPPSSDGGFDVRRYIVRVTDKQKDGRVVATCIAKSPETTCSVTGLTAGQQYWFTVVAENTVGESPASVQLDRVG